MRIEQDDYDRVSVSKETASGDWKPYRGPRGGEGWQSVSDPDYVVYDDEPPGEVADGYEEQAEGWGSDESSPLDERFQDVGRPGPVRFQEYVEDFADEYGSQKHSTEFTELGNERFSVDFRMEDDYYVGSSAIFDWDSYEVVNFQYRFEKVGENVDTNELKRELIKYLESNTLFDEDDWMSVKMGGPDHDVPHVGSEEHVSVPEFFEIGAYADQFLDEVTGLDTEFDEVAPDLPWGYEWEDDIRSTMHPGDYIVYEDEYGDLQFGRFEDFNGFGVPDGFDDDYGKEPLIRLQDGTDISYATQPTGYAPVEGDPNLELDMKDLGGDGMAMEAERIAEEITFALDLDELKDERVGRQTRGEDASQLTVEQKQNVEDALHSYFDESEVNDFYDGIGQWQRNSGTVMGEVANHAKAFKEALDIDSPHRGGGPFSSTTVSDERVQIADTMNELSRAFWDEVYDGERTMFRGISNTAYDDLMGKWLRNPTADRIELKQRALNNYTTEEAVADRWGKTTATVVADVETEQVGFAVDQLSGVMMGLEEENEVHVIGDDMRVEPGDISVGGNWEIRLDEDFTEWGNFTHERFANVVREQIPLDDPERTNRDRVKTAVQWSNAYEAKTEDDGNDLIEYQDQLVEKIRDVAEAHGIDHTEVGRSYMEADEKAKDEDVIVLDLRNRADDAFLSDEIDPDEWGVSEGEHDVTDEQSVSDAPEERETESMSENESTERKAEIVDEIASVIEKESAAASVDWQPYEGPLGGEGWQNPVTGDVVYQEERPGSETDGGGGGPPEEGGDGRDREGDEEPSVPKPQPREDIPEFRDNGRATVMLDRTNDEDRTGFTFNRDLTPWKGDAYIVTLSSDTYSREEGGLEKDHVVEMYEEYQSVLEQSPGVRIGGFGAPDGDYMSIDLNITLEDEEEALQLGRQTNQKSIWNGIDDRPMPVGGSGEPVIESPEEISSAVSELESLKKAVLWAVSGLLKDDAMSDEMDYHERAAAADPAYRRVDTGETFRPWDVHARVKSGLWDNYERREEGGFEVVIDEAADETVTLTPIEGRG